jgi:hypothetical protein
MKEIAPAPPPECNWTGFYIGAFGGCSWGDTKFREEDEFDPAYDFKTAGFLGGGEAGGNWQIGSFVLGLEVTFAGGDWSDSATIVTTGVEVSDGHVGSEQSAADLASASFTITSFFSPRAVQALLISIFAPTNASALRDFAARTTPGPVASLGAD